MSASEDEISRQLREDQDFVVAKRFENSLARVLKKYPDGVPDRAAAQMLQLTEDELEMKYQGILRKLRGKMGVADDTNS